MKNIENHFYLKSALTNLIVTAKQLNQFEKKLDLVVTELDFSDEFSQDMFSTFTKEIDLIRYELIKHADTLNNINIIIRNKLNSIK